MNIGRMRDRITFQRMMDENGQKWQDVMTVHGYINGLNGQEFFSANAGYDTALTVTISVRYHPLLMRVIPTLYRAKSKGVIYDLISPADDKAAEHKEIIFRARRVWSNDDESRASCGCR